MSDFERIAAEQSARWRPALDAMAAIPIGPPECHCGQPVITHADGFTRGLCATCDAVRCDAYPGECS